MAKYHSYFILIVFALLFIGGCSDDNPVGPAKGWKLANSPTTERLRCVHGVDGGNVYAGGDRGTLLVRENGSWHITPFPTTDPILSIWARSNTDIWIATTTTVFRYDGNSFDSVYAGGSLAGVYGIDEHNVAIIYQTIYIV